MRSMLACISWRILREFRSVCVRRALPLLLRVCVCVCVLAWCSVLLKFRNFRNMSVLLCNNKSDGARSIGRKFRLGTCSAGIWVGVCGIDGKVLLRRRGGPVAPSIFAFSKK
ncbi:unnamed protein product [Phyllotreta striolata]|uniref:Uncharacterized protein n=1 Tax=Phyllotreta striolata TaxID=444603 RepID=A0A9N9TER1_PHYSR|nr:unnamed protein product [Phyllotreta striolata]